MYRTRCIAALIVGLVLLAACHNDDELIALPYGGHHVWGSSDVGLVDGAAFPAQYTDARVRDPAIAALREHISAVADPSLAEDAAEVTLVLKDGRSYIERVTHATGAPGNPMTDAHLETKFRSLVGEVLPRGRVERLLARLWKLDQVPDVGDVVALTRMPRGAARA